MKGAKTSEHVEVISESKKYGKVIEAVILIHTEIVISGEQLKDFEKEFEELLDKYRL